MRTVLRALVLTSILTGCAASGPQTSTTPSAEHADYAVSYPGRVHAASARYEQEVTSVQQIKKDLKSYPEALQEPDWKVVQEVYELANADGQSQYYATIRQENAQIAEFFLTEQKALAQRTTASVNYQAKEKGCDVQLYGAVDHGLEKALEERLMEREKRASAAQRKLEQLDAPAQDKNRNTLERQAENIARLSHLVFVALPARHQELEQLVSTRSKVKRTLERRRKALEAVEKPKDKAAAASREEELQAIADAQAHLEDDVEAAETLLSLSEQQIEGLKASYEEEFNGLIEQVEKAQKSGTPEATDSSAEEKSES